MVILDIFEVKSKKSTLSGLGLGFLWLSAREEVSKQSKYSYFFFED